MCADETILKVSYAAAAAVASQASPAVDPSNVIGQPQRACYGRRPCVDTHAGDIIADKLSKLNYVQVCMKGNGCVA
jgi:hypothetical protein